MGTVQSDIAAAPRPHIFCVMDNADAPVFRLVLRQNFRTLVRGAVINTDNLNFTQALLEYAVQASASKRPGIEHWNDYRHLDFPAYHPAPHFDAAKTAIFMARSRRFTRFMQ